MKEREDLSLVPVDESLLVMVSGSNYATCHFTPTVYPL